jgi:hypothetical protein
MSFTEDLQNPDESPGVVAMEIIEIDELDELDLDSETARSPATRLGRVARRIAPDRGVLTSGLGMSAAAIGALVVGSMLHRGSPWQGVNAITSGLGLSGRRAPARFDARLALVSLAMIVGGSMAVAAITNKVTPARGVGRIGSGLLAGLGSYAGDRLLMKRQFLPALRHSLGPVGTAVMYGAIGLAAITARRTA